MGAGLDRAHFENALTECPETDPAQDPSLGGAVPRSPSEGLWSYVGKAPDPELLALQSIGYLDGTELAQGGAGVTVHREDAEPGLAFFTSGHGPVAQLMTLDGRQIHEWRRAFSTIWPAREVDDRRSEHQYWRRAALRPNGDVLAIVEGQGLVRLTWDSDVRWAWGGAAHHDLEVLPDERVWVLSRRARIRPALHARPVLEDAVTLLSADGCPERQINLLDAVLNSSAAHLYWDGPRHGDVFHTNSLVRLDASMAAAHPSFEAGHLLLSLRTPSALVLLDPDTEQIVWWWQGPFREQHDPQILADGTLMMFDNVGLSATRSAVRGFTLVPEPAERWRVDAIAGDPLFSRYLGAVNSLKNGNLLITESSQGAAYELTAAGEVVWAYRNPERAGSNHAYVAVLPEMQRIPLTYLDTGNGVPLLPEDGPTGAGVRAGRPMGGHGEGARRAAGGRGERGTGALGQAQELADR